MKAFLVAVICFSLLISGCIINDIYCNGVCEKVVDILENEGDVGAKKALDVFKSNEFLLKCSVDNGYVNEARVSLESLTVAYACEDDYEIKRYLADCIVRVNRVKTSLFI